MAKCLQLLSRFTSLRLNFMAFQTDALFAGFLRGTTETDIFSESAPAVNFLLEERLSIPREHGFLAAKPGPTAVGWDVPSCWQTFGNYYSEKVARPLRHAPSVSTFSAENQDNHLAIESHQDVVRLESVSAMYLRYQGDFDSLSDLTTELSNLIQSRRVSKTGMVTDEQYPRLASWLEEINQRRDARPAFAAPLGEVEQLLSAPDWATQLRNVLGLSHLKGSVSRPLPVVLFQYSLSRAEQAARATKLSAWAAVPTVLEAGGVSGPGTAFFPYPKAAADSNPFGFGITVDMSKNGGLDFKSELLHFRFDYTLNDFAMLGELTDEVTETQLLAARQRHFDLLQCDFNHRSDVP